MFNEIGCALLIGSVYKNDLTECSTIRMYRIIYFALLLSQERELPDDYEELQEYIR